VRHEPPDLRAAPAAEKSLGTEKVSSWVAHRFKPILTLLRP